MTDKTIKTRVEADVSDYEAGLRQADEATDKLEQGNTRAAGSFGRLRNAAAQTRPELGDLADVGNDVVDAFNGSSDAAVQLTRTLANVVPLGIGTVAVAVGAMAAAFLRGDAESAKLRQSIALSGNAAGVTADQLQEMADSLGELTGQQGDVVDVLAQLTERGKVAADQMPEVTRAIVAMNDAGGASVAELVDQFSKLRDEPTAGVLELNDAYNFLTPTIYEQIRALEAEGRTEEAAALAQKVSAEAVLKRAEDVKAAAGIMERAWDTVAGAAEWAWNAMKGIGAAEPIAEQIAEVEAEIARLKKLGDDGTGFNDFQLFNAEAQLRALKEKAAADAKAAEEAARHNRELREYRDLQDELEPLQTRGAAQTRTLAEALGEYRANIAALRALNPNSAMLDPAAVAAGEAAIRKQFETTRRAAGAAREARDEYGALVDALGGLSPSFRREWDLLAKAFEAGKMGAVGSAQAVAQLTAAQAALLEKQPAVSAATREQEKAAEAEARALEKAAKATEDYLAGLEDRADAAERELETYGKTASEIERTTIARLEEQRAVLQGQPGQEAAIAALDREIAARRRLAAALADTETKKANDQAAEDAADKWEQVGDRASRAFFDAIVGGGRDASDTVQDMFKALVLEPTVNAAFKSVTGSETFQQNAGLIGTAGLAIGAYDAWQNGDQKAAAAQAGAAIGSYWGPWGTAIGYIAGTLLGGQLTGGTPHRGGASFNEVGFSAGLATDLTDPNFGLDWGAYRANRGGDRSSEVDAGVSALIALAADSFEARADRYGADGRGTRFVGRFASDNDDPSVGGYRVVSAGGQVFETNDRYASDPSAGFEAFGRDSLRAEVAALQFLNLNAGIEAMISMVDPATDSLERLALALNSADEIARQFSIAEDVRALGLRDAAEDARLAGLSAASAWFESGERIRESAAAGALSVDQMAQLAAEHYANQVTLMAALEAASARIAGLFEDSARSIELAVLDDPGKYDYLRAEADQMLDVIATLMDPDQIVDYATRLNQTVNQAFGLLDDTQQQSNADAFLAYLEGANAFVQDRLEAVSDIIVQDQQSTADTLAESMSSAISRAVDVMIVDLQRAGSAIPSSISVQVNVSAPPQQPATARVLVNELGDGG